MQDLIKADQVSLGIRDIPLGRCSSSSTRSSPDKEEQQGRCPIQLCVAKYHHDAFGVVFFESKY